jgi:hypothetical protein
VNSQKHDFTAKYSLNIRPAHALGVLAAVLLVFTPLFNPFVSMGLGIALLLLQGLCHWPKKG